MAALRASRLVWPAMPVIVATMPPICSDFAPSCVITAVTSLAESFSADIASLASRTDSTPSSATVRACPAAVLAAVALTALCSTPPATPSAELRADSASAACRSALVATSPTAVVISVTARPASCDEPAISSAAWSTVALASPIRPTRALRLPIIWLNPAPSRPISLSLVSAERTVRSPEAAASLISISAKIGRRQLRMMTKAITPAASVPISAAMMPSSRAVEAASSAWRTSVSRS